MGIFKKANNIYITVRDTYTSISGSSYEEAEEVIIEATNGDLELVSQKKVVMQGLGNGKGDDKSKKTQLLVTKVEGKNTAIPYEKVTYKVTKYNQDKVSENDKKRIQWAIKINGKQEILKEKGEELKLTIKEEWAEKEIIVMPFLKKATEKVSEKTKVILRPHIRLVITNEITGYTIQSLKGLNYIFSDPAVIVPTYKVNVINYDEDNRRNTEFSFNVTRDAWYCLGKENNKYKLLNRAFIPENWNQNLYGAFWIPSYPRFSGMGAFILTRFGERKLPAKPLLTQKLLNGKNIESPRKNEKIATDVMIHIGGTYEVKGLDNLGGSYGCFGFIPESDIYQTPELAKKASENDDYDDETSNEDWKKVTNKILELSFHFKKDIKILLEYRDENSNYKPKFIYQE